MAHTFKKITVVILTAHITAVIIRTVSGFLELCVCMRERERERERERAGWDDKSFSKHTFCIFEFSFAKVSVMSGFNFASHRGGV